MREKIIIKSGKDLARTKLKSCFYLNNPEHSGWFDRFYIHVLHTANTFGTWCDHNYLSRVL